MQNSKYNGIYNYKSTQEIEDIIKKLYPQFPSEAACTAEMPPISKLTLV